MAKLICPQAYSTCICCVHFEFDSGSLAYSSMTPGSDATWNCKKLVWHGRVEDDIPKLLRISRTCAQFQHRNDEGDENG